MSLELSESVLAARGERNRVAADRPVASFLEDEWVTSDSSKRALTVLIANRECPWRCVMCDLWQNTLTRSVSTSDIETQLQHAAGMNAGNFQWLKFYNSGSFFDRAAIPTKARDVVLRFCRGLERLIVENHPGLARREVVEFAARLHPVRLEVAMGLETANPRILERLNKGFDLNDFRKACQLLESGGIDMRAFVLVRPPWSYSDQAALEDIRQTAALAADCRVGTLTLIPTRGGSGLMKQLENQGHFSEPGLDLLKDAALMARGNFPGRVQVDTWDLERFRSTRKSTSGHRAGFEYFNRHGEFPTRT